MNNPWILSLPKRARLEPASTLSFFAWLTLFFAQGLACDMPILESLYHTMFLYLDLLKEMDPDRLFEHIQFGYPTSARMHWWERLKRLATPKIASLFPKDSPYSSFSKWFQCNCSYLDKQIRYPLRMGSTTDPLFWVLYCDLCVHEKQNPYREDSLSAEISFNEGRSFNLPARKRVRDLLKTVNSMSLMLVPGQECKYDNSELFCTVPSNPVPSISIAPGFRGFEYGANKHKTFYCDFSVCCIILSRPSISLGEKKVNV